VHEDERGWLNWPDYQGRVYRRDIEHIMWHGLVHNKIKGAENVVSLAADPENALLHVKTAKKQGEQGEMYAKLLKEPGTF